MLFKVMTVKRNDVCYLRLTNGQHSKFEFNRSNFVLLAFMLERIDLLSNLKIRILFVFSH